MRFPTCIPSGFAGPFHLATCNSAFASLLTHVASVVSDPCKELLSSWLLPHPWMEGTSSACF